MERCEPKIIIAKAIQLKNLMKQRKERKIKQIILKYTLQQNIKN